jgi:hypothetical protein
MSKKVFVGDELATTLKVDGVQFSPVCIMLTGRDILPEDTRKLKDAYAIIHKTHPRIKDIKAHMAAVLEAMADEPLSPLGRSIQFESEGIDFHVMQVTLYADKVPSVFKTLKKFFRSISVNSFRNLIGKEQ